MVWHVRVPLHNDRTAPRMQQAWVGMAERSVRNDSTPEVNADDVNRRKDGRINWQRARLQMRIY